MGFNSRLRFYEDEALGLVHSLAPKIDVGQFQLYGVDSIDRETFYCRHSHPADRIQRHTQFEEYILNEVLSLRTDKISHPCTIAHGCSLGAYPAANIALRHP